MPEQRQFSPDRMLWSFALVGAVPGLDFNSIDLRPGLVRGPQVAGGQSDPDWTMAHDDGGNAEYTFNPAHNAGQLSFTYLYGAITNSLLSALVLADRQTKLCVGTIQGKDLNGQTLIVGRGARLQGMPDIGFGLTANQRTWTFLIADLNYFAGALEVIG